MVLKFKNPTEDDLKKVMVYGLDGSGKSTFAADYCEKHNLNPVVIDIEDTNKTRLYSQGRVLDLKLSSDVAVFKNVKKAITEISKTEFDTIIIDGVTSLLEMLTSDAKGIAKYSDRAARFQRILQALLDSKKNIIFIGQIDMEVIFTEEFQSPKAVIKVNALVNEKYLCYVDEKGQFSYEIKKYRTVEDGEVVPDKSLEKLIEDVQEEKTSPKKKLVKEKVPPKKEVKKVPEPEPSVPQKEFVNANEIGEPKVEDDPIRNQCIQIKIMLEKEGRLVNKVSMKSKVFQLIKDEVLPAENEDVLIDYIVKHCPEELP